MSKKNMRRISILVTAQTAKNLERLASMCGYRESGMVVDKLTREKMISLHTDALMPGERKRVALLPCLRAGNRDCG